MTYDELELEAMIQEVLEEFGDFENLDDEELYELIENTKNFTDGDAEEAYEHLNQYSPISRKRFVNLYSV
ncbi:hypothetical protein [Campylobacter hyointestinalis]|uniref:Uncharacterized protein n=1 Tax=Campylobacter hyointestinalis subsp. hyointestinalis TaxID=91352 RepID=A0A2S5J6P0_CAMHY|nr:hypothetical protein [Campylobacter hyointestinalis]ANE32452.1 hypothetical protein CHH_0781 [Campylobacter hyointestinalis subsp. hyointestinalis LMG 9260]KEA43745.1 hypothetical protein CR67_08590 [Campylobacter hyointestinalis subsp. hyointestinalis]MBT0612623.1 hypothetical protein [Campylobacter hyointestinalis subsp. hyointestinalis]MDL2346983.1 hypothetical protein [Campylobacter hyointestinalis]MDL2348404.1 hypothetical protein [Campylobacter hyointestinalis]